MVCCKMSGRGHGIKMCAQNAINLTFNGKETDPIRSPVTNTSYKHRSVF